MKIRHGSAMTYQDSGRNIRGGTLLFKTLLEGEPQAPENYILTLVSQGRYYAPRHRHNFDQFRIPLAGKFNFGPKRFLSVGQVGYFPEGTLYGPQDDDEDEREQLTLQFGGASGDGYLTEREIKQATLDLAAEGRFEKGIFYPGPDSRKERADAYKALWEHATGRTLIYPAPRYDDPIMMKVANFDWVPLTGQPGVERRLLGTFTERGTQVEQFRIAANATMAIPMASAIRLVFVVSGLGKLGPESWSSLTAVEVAPEEATNMTADGESVLYMFTLPLLCCRNGIC
jgi:hypothetical protein